MFQTIANRVQTGASSIQSDQGVFPFDARSAIHIRMKLFELPDASQQSAQNNPTGSKQSINVVTDIHIVDEFFKHHENAIISTKTTKRTIASKMTLTVWKQGGRFYVFSCQPVRIDDQQTIVGQSKGVLLPFENINELKAFLKMNFGNDDDDYQDCLEMKSLEIDFVPIECLGDAPKPSSNTDPTLIGQVCQCSTDVAGHINKVYNDR